jgi:acetyl esterase/lipase
MALLLGVAAACSSPQESGRGAAVETSSRSDSARAAKAPSGPPQANVQMQSVLRQWEALHPRPLDSLTPTEARKQPGLADAVQELLKKEKGKAPPEQIAGVSNRTIPVKGGSVPARLYKPVGNGPFPVVVYYHGGGWVTGNLDKYDLSARALANYGKVLVVSADYRKAPERKFPTAHSDAYSVYRWVVGHAQSLGGDPKRVAVAGEGAGGNLAAAVAIMARDSNAPRPARQVLIYPIAGHDFNTPSYQQNANAKPLDRATMQWFFSKYLRTPEDGSNSFIDLSHAPNLAGLPPATVITAEIDPLRSEGETYANRLKEAGVDVDYQNYRGLTHGFFVTGAVVSSAKDAQIQVADDLKKSLGVQEQAPAKPGAH